MKLLTLKVDGAFHPAVLMGEDVLDLVAARATLPLAYCVPKSIRSLLAAGRGVLELVDQVIKAARMEAAADLRETGALLSFADATLAPVVPDPAIFLSGSMNSHGHLQEMGDSVPAHPSAFQKIRGALAASGEPVSPPADHADCVDWEGELCLVVGSPCHRVSEQDALSHIAGFTLTNDISAREFVPGFVGAKGPAAAVQAWDRNVMGKNFPGFSPIGPVIATKDEFPSDWDYHMETLVNGEVMQSSTKADLVFSPAQMLSYYSHFYGFEPGDIISMGSPPGVGMARKPQLFLKPGDQVEVRVREIGVLSNVIVAPSNHQGATAAGAW